MDVDVDDDGLYDLDDNFDARSIDRITHSRSGLVSARFRFGSDFFLDQGMRRFSFFFGCFFFFRSVVRRFVCLSVYLSVGRSVNY